MKEQYLRFRLMTYNIGGGRKDSGSNFERIGEIIRGISPDILVVQEATEYQDASDVWHSDVAQIAGMGDTDYYYFLGPTLSLTEDLDVRKAIFVDSTFCDWNEWRQGNAILSSWRFARLSDPLEIGTPRNIPLHREPLYLGNRDTDSRYALVSRISCHPTYPFVIGTHFSTLQGERGERLIRGKSEEAALLRIKQARRLLDLLRKHVLEPRKLTFLMGDFNATPNELCISAILEKEGEFVRLVPHNNTGTHVKVAYSPVDHIFVFPPEQIIEYDCRVVIEAKGASDHLPLVAEVEVKTPKF